jgi:hypothetical protein
VPTLTELCRALGDDLRPVAGVTLPERAVTGVHISELMDPTPYLEGGELLLTIGMALSAKPRRPRPTLPVWCGSAWLPSASAWVPSTTRCPTPWFGPARPRACHFSWCRPRRRFSRWPGSTGR